MRHFFLLLGVVTLAKLAFAWTGWSESTLIADDAYYYFTIARNIVKGLGPTFDGITPTNGFHPLWLLLLLPAYAAAPDSMWLPIRTALSLNVLFDAVTAILLFRMLDSLHGRRAAWFVAASWVCAPTNAILAFLGMEGSLAAMLLVGLLAWILNPRARERAPRHALVAGLLWGLSGLARTDLLPLAGGVAGIAAVHRPIRWRARLRWFGLAALTAGVVSSPWFGWNLQNFGTIEQTSGRAKRHAVYVYGMLPSRLDGPIHIVATGASRLFAPVVTLTGWLTREDFKNQPDKWWPWIAGLWLVVGSWLAVAGVRTLYAGGFRELVVLLVIFLASHVVLYGFVLGFYAPWYASAFCAFAAILVGCALARMRLRSLVPVLSLLACVQVTLPILHASSAPYVRRGAEHYWAARLTKIASSYPNGVRVGLFDAGAAGYVAGWIPRLTVVNLDGIVNNAALSAIEAGRYPEYIVDHVDILLQSPKRSKMFLGEGEYERLLELWAKRGVDVDQYR